MASNRSGTAPEAEDGGLSASANAKLQFLRPMLTAIEKLPDEVIDLRPAENHTIREEVAEVCRLSMTETEDVKQSLSYTKGAGGPLELRHAFASYFNSHFKPANPVLAEHIVTASGVGNLISAVAGSICEDGDAILVAGPCWGGYHFLLGLHRNIDVVPVAPPSLRQACTEAMEAALTAAHGAHREPHRIKALLVSNPQSLVGRCYSAAAISAMMRFCATKGMHYISDEVFGPSVMTDETFEGLECDEELGPGFTSALQIIPDGQSDKADLSPSRVHVMWGLSKHFGAAGARAGALVSQQNPSLLAAVALGTFWQVSNLTALFAQRLLESSSLSTLEATRLARLDSNRRVLIAALKQLNVRMILCRGGFGLWARLAPNAKSRDEEATVVGFLREAGVMVDGGQKLYSGIDGEFGWVRISFAIDKESLRQACERIAQCLNDRQLL